MVYLRLTAGQTLNIKVEILKMLKYRIPHWKQKLELTEETGVTTFIKDMSGVYSLFDGSDSSD